MLLLDSLHLRGLVLCSETDMIPLPNLTLSLVFCFYSLYSVHQKERNLCPHGTHIARSLAWPALHRTSIG